MTGLQIFGMILFILAMVVAVGGFAFSIYRSVLLVKDKRHDPIYKEQLKYICAGLILFIVGFTASMPSIFVWNNYDATFLQYFEAISGGLLFSLSFGVGVDSFIIHYYKKDLPKTLDKVLFISLMFSIPLSILSFFLFTNGFADMGGYHFLLPNGIDFTHGLVRPDDIYKPNIAFYALCILSGALFVYFLCDHMMYKEYGKHGTLETTFLLAFPAGILGARIAYVIGNWTTDHFDYRFAHGEWWSIFAIWEGGLTILGGAIAGIIVGVFVYIKTNKGRSIFRATDLIVPTILLAQAIGRWGNFFNCEVHGVLMDENSWGWLPRIIFNNAHYSSTHGWAPDGQLYVPLFYIEFLFNILGYFVIAYLFGHLFKKVLRLGDMTAGYIIWYGYTRVFMEPLRDSSFNMGEKGYWSWFWSIAFVFVGTLLIGVNHIVRHYLDLKKGVIPSSFSKKDHIYALVGLGIPMLALLIIGIVFMSTNEFAPFVALNTFNVGLICLVSGIAFLFLMCPVIFELVYKVKPNLEVKDA